MSTISALILCKDNEDTIERVLECVKGADEIVVVDSGSGDRTAEIARRYTDKVYDQPWQGIVLQRNFALSKAACDWVFFMDTDEDLEEGLWEEIRETISQNPRLDGYAVPWLTYFLGHPLRHGGWFHVEARLFRREKASYSNPDIHHLGSAVPGPLGELKHAIKHYSFPNAETYFERFNRYSSLDAVQMWTTGLTKRNKPIRLNPHSSFSTFKFLFIDPVLWFGRRYLLRQGYKDGMHGLIYAMFGAFLEFVARVKYWDLRLHPENIEVKLEARRRAGAGARMDRLP